VSGLAITVVGAGVNGLCTAAELARRGHRVTVVAEQLPEATVSMVAGAVWFPFQVGADDQARVRAWSLATRDWMIELAAAQPEAGVDVLTAYEITAGDERPWWAEGLEVARAPAPVTGAPMAWRFGAPRAQPALLLRHFAAQLAQPIEQRKVTSLAELPGDRVVNCTGLGARALVGDADLQAIFGQVVVTGPGGASLEVSLTDDRDPAALFYAIPRRDELVLGGIARPVEGDAPPAAEPAITERVLAHAARLGLPVGEVRSVRVGLRPYRPMVRLERDPRDPRLFHNYGHGGSGFTLCHGTARAIAELVER
jgi:D-amino-acid oxidase